MSTNPGSETSILDQSPNTTPLVNMLDNQPQVLLQENPFKLEPHLLRKTSESNSTNMDNADTKDTTANAKRKAPVDNVHRGPIDFEHITWEELPSMIQKRSQKAKNAAIKKERDSLPRAKKGYTTSKGIIGETLQTLINTPEIEFFEPTEQEIARNEAGEYPFDKRSKITKETVETPKKRNLKGGEEDSTQYQEAEEEVELLLEKYLQHLHNKGAQADNPDADPDSEISAALVHYSKETAHPRAKEHIAKTLRFIQEAPQNNKNHSLPDKSWLYEHQEVRGLKGQTHLKKYGFYQTFSRRGLAGDGFLKDLTEQEGGLEKDLY
ncbi:hypothetical protein VC83_07347 [Pseudogymnoascus destructans]|uniref:Uncharacterized protein n=2 Tax=Pseudogymnoascus destructans TaxID=655981 RepID=L8G1S2_PSED2|nr:uncharacterized protein VC83_07347 [Pseudogymnoascus destructans]ELR06623.1 hypothetical protein GMDG_08096 [Pseudogymnoascus destructans 20631-21]OAF56673.1 hypothetical protein VC83_07347 [Pseudogymnoascus destructans]